MDLLARMLSKNPLTRISIERVKQHPYFKDIDWALLLQRQVKPAMMLIMDDASPADPIDDEDAYLARGA